MGIPAGYRTVLEHTDTWFRLIRKPPWDYCRGCGHRFSILYMAIRIFFARNAKVREEIKEEAMIKGMVAIMIFSVPFWLGIFKLAGEMLI